MQRLTPRAGVVALALIGGIAGCGAAKEAPRTPPDQAAPLAPSSDEAKTEAKPEAVLPSGRAWAESTYSPQPASSPDPDLDDLLETCGRGDAALHEVAAFVAEYQAAHDAPPSLDEVNFELKRRGSPYVMPRLWAATASGAALSQLAEPVRTWSRGKKPRGQFRCGIGSFDVGSERHVALLQADVVAELAPLPTRVEPDAYLEVEATFLLPTTAASIVLLPPEGSPRTLDTKLEGGRAKARLLLPTAGTWLVQIMATQEGGPLPVASALISSGKEPPDAVDARPVPGEKAFDEKLTAADAVFAMLNAARKEEGLPLLSRNAKLDRAATSHTERMREQGHIGHDSGDGDPARRVSEVGLAPKATGENVALAQTVSRLHRALWASPSHRENMLLRRWDQVGVSVLPRDDGSLYCTQLFIDAE